MYVETGDDVSESEEWSRWAWWFDLICEWHRLETEGMSLSAFELNYKSKCIPAVFL